MKCLKERKKRVRRAWMGRRATDLVDVRKMENRKKLCERYNVLDCV